VPFFVEKPLAADLTVAEDVAATVAAADLPTATGYHWRHLDTVGQARAALSGGAVRLVDARWWGTCPPPSWWRRQNRSGGQVVEQATHVLDLVRVLAGEVVEVVGGSAPSSAQGRDVADATAAVLRLESGAVGTVSTSCVLPALTAAGLEVVADRVCPAPDGDLAADAYAGPRACVSCDGRRPDGCRPRVRRRPSRTRTLPQRGGRWGGLADSPVGVAIAEAARTATTVRVNGR
jgi:myo-inositol 2-dehydrogenase/D-chiro-inositol 1-dehydrogenase